jgi:hypothetical protein
MRRLILSLLLCSCTIHGSASATWSTVEDAAADVEIETEIDATAEPPDSPLADSGAPEDATPEDAAVEPDASCWLVGQSCASSASCCPGLWCSLDLCQPCTLPGCWEWEGGQP